MSDITYTLKRSQRKTLSLRISPEAEIFLYVPMRASERDIQAFLDRNRAWLEKNLARMRDRLEKHPVPDEQHLSELRAEAKRVIPPLVAFYAEKMGVHPTKVRINAAKTRRGSCSAKGVLNFSCRIMDYPMDAIEYVVVHELAHIKEMNHSQKFYDVVASVLPDYKRRKKLFSE